MPPYVTDGGSPTAVIYKCFHSLGQYGTAAGKADIIDPSNKYVFTLATLIPVVPCTATPTTHGTPLCTPLPLIGTSSKKLYSPAIPAIKAPDIQLTAPVGLPLTLQSAGESVNAEGS